MRPAGAFGAANWSERGLQNTSKNKHQKNTKIRQKCTQKRKPGKLSFCGFRGLGKNAFQGGPKDPPEHPTRSNLVKKLTKSGTRNWISVMFYWVLSQTEPTCPKVLPRCFQMFPDASRVLIRVICKDLPTRRQEKQTKTKTYTCTLMGF